jgi:penicillin-binding protein 2
MRSALQVSSDVYFYTLGARAESLYQRNGSEPIQQWASRYGLGDTSGIDLPGEAAGNIPSPEWRDQLYKQGDTDRPWSIGDMVQTAVGQGDVQVSPLQLAVAYAALANGGDIVQPHVGMRVEDPTGRIVEEINPPIERHINIDPATQQVILDGLHAAATEPGGTSYPIFGNYPISVAGKTGTAQTTSGYDQSWYACLAPYPNPQYVVVATVERGGFGADAAAPAVSDILPSIPGLLPNRGQSSASSTTTSATGY